MLRPSPGEIDEIDGLRGLAIFAVMVHRLWPRDAVNRLSVAADAGWIGVDLFFVVSGFLITRILLETRDEPGYFRNFYARRVLRIFPLYFLFVGTLFIVFPLAGNSEYIEKSGSPIWYLSFLGNIPEGLLGYDPPYWLAPVWSLAIEEQFYLTFPWLVYWLGPQRLTPALIGIFLLAPTVRLATMMGAPDQERIQYLFTLCRVDAIAAGCLIAVIMRTRNLVALRGMAILIACCAGAVAVISDLDRTTPFGRVAGYSFVAIGCGALLFAVLNSRDRWWTAPLRLPPLRYVGKLCFGLYLLHRPADTITTAVANRFDVDADRISWIPIKIAVAVAFASLSWFIIEKPLLRFKRYFTSPKHPSAAAGVAAVGIVLLVGCHGAPGIADDHRPDAQVDGARNDAGEPFVDASEGVVDASVEVQGRVLYAEDRRHSPITPAIMQRLQGIAVGAQDGRVFAKLGDSITDTPSFLTCFDGGPIDFGSHTQLAATVSHFMQGQIGGATPFVRDSVGAQGGWTGADLMTGSPCALERELTAASPRYGVLLLGTNDNRYGRSLDAFGTDLWNAVDLMIARGVVPILSTMPPMFSYPEADARVPLFNRVVRAIAQGRTVPLVDLYRELVPLPNQGIAADGLHPTVSPNGACMLTASGLQYGYNARNLVTLEALARTRAAVSGVASDAAAAVRAGSGTASDPWIGALPLVDLGDTRMGESAMNAHVGCAGVALGHEIVYELELAQAATIDAYVIDRGGVNVDVFIETASGCIASGDGVATATIAGKVRVIVDAPSVSADGEYLLVVQAR